MKQSEKLIKQKIIKSFMLLREDIPSASIYPLIF